MTAWLGLIAMCLVAFAPTVSHFVRAARTVVVPVCTADHHAPSAGHAMGSHADPAMGGHADHGSQPMDDCGYCDLLNHVPAVAMVPPAPAAALSLLFVVFVLPALRRYTPLGAFPSGRPRAPPAIS